MAEKGKMKGGHDPSEMARRRWEKQREVDALEAAKPAGEKDFRAEMEELAVSKSVPAHVRQSALRWLLTDGEKTDGAEDWKKSVQVRPDYEEPSWDEVLVVARVAGCNF